jgi:hypothetical protein
VIDNRNPAISGQEVRTTTTRVTNTMSGPTTSKFAQIMALSMALGGLNKQAFHMDRQLLSLQQRYAELTNESLEEADSLGRYDVAARQTARHAKAMEKKINRQSAAQKSSSTALTSQMTSLSTYLPFPYEQERKRVLAWFEK